MRYLLYILPFLLSSCWIDTRPDLVPIVSLNGSWKFNIGDDSVWAQPSFDDTQWDNLFAPGKWKEQGYVGYNGFAWYRKKIHIPHVENNYLMLDLGKINDVNEVFFNGKRIGQMGLFPPNYTSSYFAPIRYHIPSELIQSNNINTLAIRIYDNNYQGGIIAENLIIGYETDFDLLSMDLSGDWQISFQQEIDWPNHFLDDTAWNLIKVPATWESQGYNNYNGVACYRKTIELSPEIIDSEPYIVLGKIDNTDEVYINGDLIGRTNNMKGISLGKTYYGDWQIRRAYKLPKEIISDNNIITIAVIVTDTDGFGGIYEGPIGIMSKKDYNEYVRRYK